MLWDLVFSHFVPVLTFSLVAEGSPGGRGRGRGGRGRGRARGVSGIISNCMLSLSKLIGD